MSKGNTANLCAIDIYKALCSFIKINKKTNPCTVITSVRELVIELLFLCQMGRLIFTIFKLDFGVRQGSVMSPLFGVYVDDLAKCCDCSRDIYTLCFKKKFTPRTFMITV